VDPQQPYQAPAPAQLSVGDAISYGFEATKRHAGVLILMAFLVWIINGAVSNIGSFLDNDLVTIVGQLISIFVGAFLYLGVFRIVLAVTAGEQPDIAMLFRTDRYWPFLGAYLLFGLGVAFGLVLLIVPGILFAIAFQFYGYALIQDPGLGVIDAFKRSNEITRGHWGTLFVLGLAVFGVNLLGFLACCIGLLFTIPLTSVAHAYAYKTLAGQPVAPVEGA
jgi:uncharacterized membrane protein